LTNLHIEFEKNPARAHRGARRRLLSALLAVSTATLPAIGGAGTPATTFPHAVISGLPLSFEPTASRAGDGAEFVAHGPKYAIALQEEGAALASGSDVIRLKLLGARGAVKPAAEQPLPGIVNYIIGNDPTQWRTGVKTFAQVRYSGVYPGVDLMYYGTQGRLEYDFAVAPGASAAPIRLAFAGAETVRLDARGNLKVRGNGHELVFERPVAYQMNGGRRAPVAARYQLNGDTVRFQVGAYDHGKRLIIDPVLSYFSYLGGSGYDVAGIATPTGSPFNTSGQAAAIDSAGDLYVTGYTESTNFPVKAAYETAPVKVQGGTPPSAFVTKFAPDGKSVIFSTYLGGTVGSDQATSIAVDSSGNAFVVGTTGSNDFPVTSGAYQTVCNPKFTSGPNVEVPNCPGGSGIAAFVSKFSPTGALLYSTFLSGSNTNTTAYAVAVDTTGRAYVAGLTFPGAVVPAGIGANQQIPFPTTPGAVLGTPPYSTGVGGYQNVLSAQQDAFISVFDPTLSTLLYSSLFGEPQVSNAGEGFEGASFTLGQAVIVDASGDFYLAGTSQDASLETTAGAYEANASSCGTVTNNTLLNCAFVAKFSPVGSGTPKLIYATYLGHTVGGGYGDLMTGIAADAAGDAYITGYTNQATFPTTSGAYQTTCDQYGVNGNTDPDCGSAFIAKLNPGGTALVASTYFGGYYAGANGIADNVTSMGPIALDAAGNVYIDGVAANGLPQVDSLGTNDGTGGATSPFVAELNSSLTTLMFSTLFSTGGQSQLDVNGLALDTAGNIYVAGSVGSPPSSAATSGAFQPAYGGGDSDAFVAKITVLAQTATALTASPSATTTGKPVTLTATVAQLSGSAMPTGSVTFDDGATPIGSSSLNSSGVATLVTAALGAGLHTITAAYGGDKNDAASSSASVTVTIKIAVPNVVGLTQAAANSAITAAGLTVGTITTQSSSTVPAGSVISQSPAAGTSVAAGVAVSLVVSSGSAPVTVPNVVGLTQAAAGSAITAAGLKVGTITSQSSSTVPAGTVISQSPAGGTSAAAGSAVSLVVSSGSAKVTVPNVVGLTQSAAGKSITSVALTLGTVTTKSSSTVPSGTVISQSPAGGTSVATGSTVSLVVSSGPAAATVPNVVNLKQAAAASAISSAGLTVGTVTTATSYTVAAGNVVSESPLAGTSVAAGSAVNLVIARNLPICDVNGDGQIDSRDIALIDAALNTPAAGPYDPRDANRDGVINILDARKCVTLCTHAGCAIN
jgi:beta-lactam-binding protein with PASTA domain